MKISVIIPVYGEDKINTVIENLSGFEVIVSDCDGRTLEKITDSNVIKVLSEKGRGVQQNAGASMATGDIFLFLHADTRLHEDWQHIVIKTLTNYQAGAFSLGINSERPIFRIIEKLSTLRSRFTRIPYGDQAIFMRRQIYEEAGGFKPYPIFEDVRLMQDIRKLGYSIKIVDEKVITSARRWEKEGVIYTTLRNWLITLLYLCGVPPLKLKKLYK